MGTSLGQANHHQLMQINAFNSIRGVHCFFHAKSRTSMLSCIARTVSNSLHENNAWSQSVVSIFSIVNIRMCVAGRDDVQSSLWYMLKLYATLDFLSELVGIKG